MADEITLTLEPPYIGSAYSPQVTVESTEGGHSVTITSDVPGEGIVAQTFDVMDGDASQAIEDAEAAAAAARAAASSASSAATSATNAAGAASTAAGQANTAAGAATAAASEATGAAASARAAAAGATEAAGLAADATAAATAAASNAGTATREAIAATTGANNAAATANAAAGSAAIAAADATTAAGTATDAATSATSAASAAGTAADAASTAATAANAAADAATEAAEGITDAWLPSVTVGAADGITGGGPLDTAAWTYRACPGTDGPATIESIHGRTVRWNQLVGSDTASVTVPSGHKYVSYIETIVDDATTTVKTLATSDGTAIATTGGTDCVFDLTAMFGAGNEPSTVAEFEALYPEPYYPYDAGSLLSVQMEGIETTGFNQWDEEWESGLFANETGAKYPNSNYIRSKNPIPCFPSTTYSATKPTAPGFHTYYYDADMGFINHVGAIGANASQVQFTTPANARYMNFCIGGTRAVTTYNHDICINISDPTRNGEYEPYWSAQRLIDAGTLRGAGTVYDEQTADERIVRVGERAYQSGDESDPSVVTDGTTTHYALATPTTTPIDPALNLTYKAAAGGTERILHDEPTAPPTLVVQYGSTADGIRDRALEAIAAHDGPIAQTYHAVGTYLTLDGTLYKVTTAIAAGERITQGTNVVATTVMAEVLALTQ